jgi:phosphonate transport system substrate-binding protein
LGYDALVQNEEFGAKKIRGVLFVRHDSGITSVDQLRGKAILFGGGPRAMMSYIVPTYLLRQAGLEAGDYREIYAVNPPNAIFGIFFNQADAGGAGSAGLKMPMVTSRIDVKALAILAESEPLAHLPWAVKEEMPEENKRRLQRLFLELKETPEGRAILQKARLSGFNPVADSDYNPHRAIIDAIR